MSFDSISHDFMSYRWSLIRRCHKRSPCIIVEMTKLTSSEEAIENWFTILYRTAIKNWRKVELVVEDTILNVFYSDFAGEKSLELLRLATIAVAQCPFMVRHHFDTPPPSDMLIVSHQSTRPDGSPEIRFDRFDATTIASQFAICYRRY